MNMMLEYIGYFTSLEISEHVESFEKGSIDLVTLCNKMMCRYLPLRQCIAASAVGSG